MNIRRQFGCQTCCCLSNFAAVRVMSIAVLVVQRKNEEEKKRRTNINWKICTRKLVKKKSSMKNVFRTWFNNWKINWTNVWLTLLVVERLEPHRIDSIHSQLLSIPISHRRHNFATWAHHVHATAMNVNIACPAPNRLINSNEMTNLI